MGNAYIWFVKRERVHHGRMTQSLDNDEKLQLRVFLVIHHQQNIFLILFKYRQMVSLISFR